jgi:hypothetical protein
MPANAGVWEFRFFHQPLAPTDCTGQFVQPIGDRAEISALKVSGGPLCCGLVVSVFMFRRRWRGVDGHVPAVQPAMTAHPTPLSGQPGNG